MFHSILMHMLIHICVNYDKTYWHIKILTYEQHDLQSQYCNWPLLFGSVSFRGIDVFAMTHTEAKKINKSKLKLNQ